MKVLDFTPFRQEDGQYTPQDRIKAMFKFGFSWFTELEAQDHVVAVFSRQLERNFTLFRNLTLPGTEIMYTMILVGPPGIFVLSVTNERGVFRAKGTEWGTMEGEKFVPGKTNPLKTTARLVTLIKKYLEKQELGNIPVEGAVLAANPGLHVDSVRPAVRVFMFDALDRFAVSVAQARPVLTTDILTKAVERLQTPMRKKAPVAPPAQPAESAPDHEETPAYMPQGYGFDDDQRSGGSLDSDRMSLGFGEEAPQPQAARAERPVRRTPAKPSAKKKPGGFQISMRQMYILGGIFIFWVCLLVIFIVWVVANAI